MPFYEYECQSCKFYTEVMQKITDAPLTKCPSCGKKALQKLVSAPVFRLKGAGWYETDFKSDKENKRNLVGGDKEESKAEAPSAAKADDKGDAKPAPAVETKSAASESAEPKRRSASASKSAGRGVAPRGKSKPAAKAASRAPSRAKAKPKGKTKGRR